MANASYRNAHKTYETQTVERVIAVRRLVIQLCILSRCYIVYISDTQFRESFSRTYLEHRVNPVVTTFCNCSTVFCYFLISHCAGQQLALLFQTFYCEQFPACAACLHAEYKFCESYDTVASPFVKFSCCLDYSFELNGQRNDYTVSKCFWSNMNL